MSQLISRILLTILLFPTAVLFLFISFIFIEEFAFSADALAMVFSTLLTCGYIVGYWLLLWRRDVVWTPHRIRSSLWLALGAIAAGIVLGWLLALVLPYEEEIGTILGSLTATVLWVGATVFAWRETPGERAARLARAGADTWSARPAATTSPACARRDAPSAATASP